MTLRVIHEHLWSHYAHGLLKCRCGKIITVQQWADGWNGDSTR
jgi:hypothetical protein